MIRVLSSVLCLVLALSTSSPGATWHVAGNGNDAGDGSEKAPFASVSKAVEAAAAAGDASEIVIHAGTYRGDILIPAPKTPVANPADVPAWIIRAATGADGKLEEVIIDGGQRITDAQLVDAERGIYFHPVRLAFNRNMDVEPGMWEADSRLRYPYVADRRAVEAFPGSLAPGKFTIAGEEKEGVFFRTTDSKPPAAHDLGIARDRFGMTIQRPNVTVKGLHFRNLQLYFGVHGISIEAANVTVDSCHAWNCYGLASVGEKVPDAKVINSSASDVAAGVKSYGINTIVENCRFFRIPDRFVVQENEQDQCGIQFYTSHTQTARGNLCVGFNLGIFIKASGGLLILENNTVIASLKEGGERGIGPNTWRPGTICRGNVVVGYSEPIGLSTLIKECIVTDNLIWRTNPKTMSATAEKIKSETGGETIVAPPQFVDESKQDYRLAPTSAAASIGPDKKPIGATGVAPQGTVAQAPPDVKAPTPAQIAAPQPAKIVGTPLVLANDHGAVVIFKTDVPCMSALLWGKGAQLDRRVDDARNWPVNDRGTDPATAKTTPHTDHCLAIINNAESGATYAFQILLDSGSGNGPAVHSGEVTLKGPARTLHVATTGKDDDAGGALEHPFASLQFAVDRALPGDRVIVAGGIYCTGVWMTHGGVKGHPITIESAKPWTSGEGAVLDGKREWESAIHLGRVSRVPETWALGCLAPSQVSHVRITGFEMRWYNGLCVHADEATDIVVDNCKFWGRHYVKGRPGICEGIGAYHCERVTVDHNLFFTLNTAVRFNSSAGLRLTSNTAAKCFHRVIGLVGAKDIYIRNNSFAFGSSYLLAIHGVAEGAIDSDYNNFAVHLREDSEGFKTVPAEEIIQREKNDFYYGESKSLSNWDERTGPRSKQHDFLPTLTPWREATGQDKHSISAHPRYADPRNFDYRLLPNSPNIGKGENGADIGALGVISQ